ncbi:Hsp33 family molecular chaperone HslO [Kangiella sp. HZ709]|uniref:Hsp33 family molecular chaperone HslO n=1 Tax=Kangiella sp. HZ709 TaxID=2666328 RepID=UPI0012B0BC87|nr:Hsp33 family molecular chaperone HslO [Kangiella sp. HZ709]MRX28213.1 Hsp33 family molecular chaperone HslO [Kangiella sp. HZ709]
MSDNIQRFSFAELPIRGEIISLTKTIDTICDQHQYPKEVRHLLAESLAACCLLADIIKIEGRVSLQLQSASVIKLLLVECDNQGRMRGLLHINEEYEHLINSDPFNFKQWVANGQLAITIDPDKGQRYQGVVPLDQMTLAECLEDYFNMSEQLPTHIKIFADHHKAFGIFIQTLPQAADSSIGNEDTQQAFEHVTALTETVKQEEAFELSHEELLYRLFHQDEVSIYPEKTLKFECSCSRERNMAALTTLDPAELVSLVEEQNEIEMVCDFCSNKEIFNRQQIMELLISEADQGVIN